jgi:ketosteroid isomerase-like protein
VSQENVDLVLGLQPSLDVDLIRLFRDERRWAVFTDRAAPFYHSDFETLGTVLGVEKWGVGMNAFRAFWLDWLAPWMTYRTEPDEAVDLGAGVLVLSRSFGTLEGSTQEVREAPAAVWGVRDGKIARAEFFLDRHQAVKAVGLEG